MADERLLCPHCGSQVDERDLHVRFHLPDPLLRLPERDRAEYADADIIAVPRIGTFARVLLPINLTGGYRLTVGTWLGFTDRGTYERATELWNSPGYRTLRISGRLANRVVPWRATLGLKVQAVVVDGDEVPHVDEIRSLRLRKLVSTTWERARVMAAFPDELWHRRAAAGPGR